MTLPSDLQLVRFDDGGWRLYAPTADPSCDTPLARGLSYGKNPHTGEYMRPDVHDYGKALEALAKQEQAQAKQEQAQAAAPLAITASWTEAGIIYHAMEDGRVWRWFAGEWHCDTDPLPEFAWRADTAAGGAL
jgi:hypothetical protein